MKVTFSDEEKMAERWTWGTVRQGSGFHAGLLGDGQCVVGRLGRAGAGGAVSSQKTLHIIKLRPLSAEPGKTLHGSPFKQTFLVGFKHTGGGLTSGWR